MVFFNCGQACGIFRSDSKGEFSLANISIMIWNLFRFVLLGTDLAKFLFRFCFNILSINERNVADSVKKYNNEETNDLNVQPHKRPRGQHKLPYV
jgi:hypothetical protein